MRHAVVTGAHIVWEDDLQTAQCTLQNRLELSPRKPKVMVFEGEIPVRSGIVIIDNTVLEQANTLT
jgi:hypothetical protein